MIKIGKYSVFIPKGEGNSLTIVNALFAELINQGIVMDDPLFERLASLDEESAKNTAKQLSKEFSIGKINKPLFNNWEFRKNFSAQEFVIQILGYYFQFCGNDVDSSSFRESLLSGADIKSFKKLSLSSQEELEEYADKILSAALSQDKKTSQQLLPLFEEVPHVLSKKIQSDEVRIAVLLQLKEKLGLFKALQFLNCRPADVLRYSAALVNWDFVKLPSEAKFASLPWKERKDIVKYPNIFDFEFLSEGMGMNRSAWSSFFKHIHLFSQKEFTKYQGVLLAAYVSVGGSIQKAPKSLYALLKQLIKTGSVEQTFSGALAYRTFASRMSKAIEEKNFEKISELCKKRSGYLLRNLTSILNGIQNKDYTKFVDLVSSQMGVADAGNILPLIQIDAEASYRIIDVKGDTRIEPANYGPVFGLIQESAIDTLRRRFGLNGRVVVDDDLKDKIVPFMSKNSELGRGSRIKINEKYLYIFMHWVQGGQRTDLDLSFLTFDEHWNQSEVAFYRQANGYLTLGGDITSAPAPNGATEYGKISVNDIPSYVKYIVPTTNVFSGSPFSELKEARAGFWQSNSGTFKLSSEATFYDLSAPAQMNTPFIFDVENREIIIVDFNRRERLGWGATAYGTDLKKVVLATQNPNYLTNEKLAKILSKGRKPVLRISNKEGENNIKPEELFSLFSK